MRSIAMLAAGALLIGGAGSAQAVTLVAPPEGARSSSTPTFSWQLAPDEQTVLIEWTKNPALGPDGMFVDDPTKKGDNLAGSQTSYTVPRSWYLAAGRWWWRVEARDQDSFGRSSEVRSFTVPDDPPRIAKVGFRQVRCLRLVDVRFEFSDNSESKARATVEFFTRRRGGRRLARVSLGQTRRTGLGGSKESLSLRRPRRVQAGRTYYARLVVRDSAGQVSRSTRKRIRVPRC